MRGKFFLNSFPITNNNTQYFHSSYFMQTQILTYLPCYDLIHRYFSYASCQAITVSSHLYMG